MNRMLLTGTVALAAGLSIGGAAGAVAAPTPDPETVTVTKRVEVEVVPQVCLDALDAADTGFGKAADILALSIEGLDISRRLVQAALEDDYFEVSTLLTSWGP